MLRVVIDLLARSYGVGTSTTETGALGRRFGPLHDLDDQASIARSVTPFSETVLDPGDVPGNSLGSVAVQHLPEAADVALLVGSERSDADLYNGGRALALTGRHVGEALAATLGPESIVTLDSTRLAYARPRRAALRAVTIQVRSR